MFHAPKISREAWRLRLYKLLFHSRRFDGIGLFLQTWLSRIIHVRRPEPQMAWFRIC